MLQSGVEFSIYVSPYAPAYGNWAFRYEPEDNRFSPTGVQGTLDGNIVSKAENPIPEGVDIKVTHDPPERILDAGEQGNAKYQKLLKAARRVKPR